MFANRHKNEQTKELGNGNKMSNLESAREILKKAAVEATTEPVKAEVVPLTPQERADHCQEAIRRALEQYACALVPSLEEYAPNRFLRSLSVQITALIQER